MAPTIIYQIYIIEVTYYSILIGNILRFRHTGLDMGSMALEAAAVNYAFGQITGEMGRQSGPRSIVEPQTAAQLGCLAEMALEVPALTAMVMQASSQMVRTQIEVGSTVSNLRTGNIHYFNTIYEDFSDTALTTKQLWKPLYLELAADLTGIRSPAASYLMNVSLFWLNAVTPVRSRYINPRLYVALLAERFPDGITMLDIGGSLGLGPLDIMNPEICESEDFTQVGYHAPGSKQAIDLTDKANAIVNRPPIIKEIVTVDKLNFYDEVRGQYDEELTKYALSGLRSSERNNKAYMDDLRALLDKKRTGNSGVTYYTGNFLNSADLGEFKEKFPDGFKAITANYLFNGLTRKDRIMMHRIARSLLADDGILIYNHPGYIPSNARQPVNMQSVRFGGSHASERWHSRSHVEDRLLPNGLQTMGSYEDNRFRNMELGMGQLVVNGTAEPIGELVKHG